MMQTKLCRIVIIEDEVKAREILRQQLQDMEQYDIQIIGEADNVKDGIRLIEEKKPELVFLDIELKDGTGFDLLEGIRDIRFEVVFTTAFDNYAIKAFQCCALHYLMKPLDERELAKAMDRYRSIRATNEPAPAVRIDALLQNLRPDQQKKIAIRESSGIQFVKIQSIVRCTAEGNYTQIYLDDGTKILSAKNLKEYENLLEQDDFFRVHHSQLINLSLVKRYKSGRGGTIVMEDGTEIEVAIRKKEELMKKLG